MGGWTASAVAASVALFLVAGVCEVGGGWLVWQACREVRDEGIKESSKSERERDHLSAVVSASASSRASLPRLASHASFFRTLLILTPQGKPWWWALVGSLILVLYGFVPCAQPIADFGRLYAAYGGFFVALSVAWARAFDGFTPDVGDFIGCAIALIGAGVIVFYPRQGGVSSREARRCSRSSRAARETVYLNEIVVHVRIMTLRAVAPKKERSLMALPPPTLNAARPSPTSPCTCPAPV